MAAEAAGDVHGEHHEDEEDENWPMWSKVWDQRARNYYYFNNFDASLVLQKPEEYVEPSQEHEAAAPPSHKAWLELGHARKGASIVELYHDPFLSDLPKPMAKLIAAQRIQNMARSRQGRKKARAKKAFIEFGRYDTSTADDSTAMAHKNGWVCVQGIRRYAGERHAFWHHVERGETKWAKPIEILEGEIKRKRLEDQKAQELEASRRKSEAIAKRAAAQKARELRRKKHEAMMKKGAEDIKKKVDAIEARRNYKAEQRAKRAAEHAKMMEKSYEEMQESHEAAVKEKQLHEEKKKAERSARLALHKAKMAELSNIQAEEIKSEKLHEHDVLLSDLHQRAKIILEAQAAPWTLTVGIKQATDLRAADWAMGGRGKSDPYATIMLNGREVGKTKTVKKSLNPVWDEVFQIKVSDAADLGGDTCQWAQSELTVRIFDYDLVGDNDFLGEVQFKDSALRKLLGLSDAPSESDSDAHRAWLEQNKSQSTLQYASFKLQEKDGAPPPSKKKLAVRGDIEVAADLRVVLKHKDPVEEEKNSKAKKEKARRKKERESKSEEDLMKEYFQSQLPLTSKGNEARDAVLALDTSNVSQWTLSVNIEKAVGIKKADRWGKSDPYVKVLVNEVAAGRSSTLSKTLNPVWNENIDLLISRKKHFGNGKKGKKPLNWINSTLVFEIFDHDLVGMDDPIGRISIKGEELITFLATSTLSEKEMNTTSLPVGITINTFTLFERGDGKKRAKGVISVKASLSPASNEAEEAMQEELKRLEELEARKVDAPWTVWIKLYDQEVHNYYWVNSNTGESTYNLPVPPDSTIEKESTRKARGLPKDIAKGPPEAWIRHTAARKIQNKIARRRSARMKVLERRGAKNLATNGGGASQTWVQCFHPLASRLYYWHSSTGEIVWDTPPSELVELRNQIVRSLDPKRKEFYYHSAPFTVDSWTWILPIDFHPGGKSHLISAATTIQAAYRSYISRMSTTRRFESREITNLASLVSSDGSPRSRRREQLRKKKKKSLLATGEKGEEDLTADERAEKQLTRAVRQLKDIISAFELPYRHRMSRRSDRRKVLNRARHIIQEAVSASQMAANHIAVARGLEDASSVRTTTKGAGRTTKEIMNDEIATFESKVKQASQALEGTIGIVAWYEVETVYRLKRLLSGLTALDIYHLVAPASEDRGATHTELKNSIRRAEGTMREYLNKLGKAFRKALRRWGRMMNEDRGAALAAVSTSELLPVDRSRDNTDAMHGDPLRYGRYYWMTVKTNRLMPFPVELGGLSYQRIQAYVGKISRSVYIGLEHARTYLTLVGKDRDIRIGREELLRMRREEARIRTAIYMTKLRAEKRAKQEVFHSMCRSQWERGSQRRESEEREQAVAAAAALKKKQQENKVKRERQAELLMAAHRARPNPWEAIRFAAPIEVIREKLEEEYARWTHQESKIFDVNSRNPDTGETLLGAAVFFNHFEAAQHLIDMGADVNAIDSLAVRSSPLIIAARRGDRWLSIARLLCMSGAKLDAQDVRGDTALHVAARSGNLQMTKILLSCRGGRRTDGSRRYFIDENNPASGGDNSEMIQSPSSQKSSHLLYLERRPPESGAYGNAFFRMLAVPNYKACKAIDLAEDPEIKAEISRFQRACDAGARLNEDDLKYLQIRRRQEIRKEELRLAEDLSGGAFTGGLSLSPLMSMGRTSRPKSSERGVPDSTKLRRRLEATKKKHRLRKLRM